MKKKEGLKKKKKQLKREKLIREFEEMYKDHVSAYYGGFKPSLDESTIDIMRKTLKMLKKTNKK